MSDSLNIALLLLLAFCLFCFLPTGGVGKKQNKGTTVGPKLVCQWVACAYFLCRWLCHCYGQSGLHIKHMPPICNFGPAVVAWTWVGPTFCAKLLCHSVVCRSAEHFLCKAALPQCGVVGRSAKHFLCKTALPQCWWCAGQQNMFCAMLF